MAKRLGPNNRTHPLIWCVSIICAILTVLIIMAGIIIFIGYITIKPRVPRVGVSQAQLDTIYFDEAGLLMLQVTIIIKAENDNAKALARFYDMIYALSFHSQKIAYLKADPFDVRPAHSKELSFVAQSNSIPLNREEGEAVGTSLQESVIDLDLKGTSRTRWKIWLIGSVKYKLQMDCKLHLPINRTTIYPPGCSSRMFLFTASESWDSLFYGFRSWIERN